jgi:hypothetical protein
MAGKNPEKTMLASGRSIALFRISILLGITAILFAVVPAAYADHCGPNEVHTDVDGVLGCRKRNPTQPPPPTATPTFTPTATSTHTQTPAPTATNTPLPTATARPTRTPIATRTPSLQEQYFDWQSSNWIQEHLPWFPDTPTTGLNVWLDALISVLWMIPMLVAAVVVFVGWYVWKARTWEDFWTALEIKAPWFTNLFTAKFWSPVANWTTNAWDSVKNWTTGATNTVSSTAKKGAKTVSKTAQKAGKGVENTAEDAGKSIEKGAKKAGKKIKKLFK